MTCIEEPLSISIVITDAGQWDHRGDADTRARRYCAATGLVARNALNCSAVGGALRETIDEVRRTITIQPQDGTEDHRLRGSASCGLMVRSPAELQRATPAAEQVHTRAGRPTDPPLTGTGQGATGAAVYFTPLHYGPTGWQGARATLLHELVHAWQMLAGQSLTTRITGYPNLEEWEAVTITNMFCSELGWPLRDGYDFFDAAYQPLVDALGGVPERAASPQPPPRQPGEIAERGALSGSGLATPVGQVARSMRGEQADAAVLRDFSRAFAVRYRAELRTFVRANEGFCNRLRRLDAERVPFNPARDLAP